MSAHVLLNLLNLISAISRYNLSLCTQESNIRALVLLNLLNLPSLAFYLFSPTHVINSIKHEHSCKILYICTKRSTHVRFSISATRGALMKDPLYLQQEELS